MNISHWWKKLGWSSYVAQVYALGLVIGAGLIIGIGLQVAQAWTAPGANPPDNGNISAPITTSSDLQTKTGSLGIGGNLLLSGLFEMDYSDTYDVYIQGMDGAAVRRALTGNKSSDILYLNEGAGYTGGTTVGGPKLTASKICLPNSTESNCRTSWPAGVVIVSAGGSITSNATVNIGSDWTLVIFSGGVDGFIYKIGGSVVARLGGGTGSINSTLTSTNKCISVSTGSPFCVKIDGVGDVIINSGILSTVYLAIK